MSEVVDTTGLEQHIQRFYSGLKPQWRQLATAIQAIVREVLISEMGPAGDGFNTGDKLRNQTGATVNSFVTKVDVTDNGAAFSTESNAIWLAIQEKGGFIKSKGKMDDYFWALYAERNEERFKRIALSIIKKGGVNIKGRHTVERTAAGLVKRSAEITGQVIDALGMTWMRTA